MGHDRKGPADRVEVTLDMFDEGIGDLFDDGPPSVQMEDLVAGDGVPPIPDFVSGAAGGVPPEVLCRTLLYAPRDVTLVLSKISKKDLKKDPDRQPRREIVRFIPGHIYDGPYGPRPGCSDVMIIGKMPWTAEWRSGRLFQDESGVQLRKAFDSAGQSLNGRYVTNIVRFVPPSKDLKADWVKMCWYFLYQEIAIIRPKYILVLGADALKGLFGKSAILSEYRGTVREFMGARVWTAYHPAAVVQSPEIEQDFRQDIAGFCDLVSDRLVTEDPVPHDYAVIDNLDDLNRFVDWMIASGHDTMSVDCEWSGKSHMTGTLLTVQVCWAPGKVRLVHLHSQGNVPAFRPSVESAVEPLRRLLCRDGARLVGHWFAQDLLRLINFGVDCREQFRFDTMLAYHAAVDESGDLSLDAIRVKYTQMPKYDIDLNNFIRNNSISTDEGYGGIPDSILHPYALQDADCEFRCHIPLLELVEKDTKLSDLFHAIIMPANQPAIGIQLAGMATDEERFFLIAEAYRKKLAAMLDDIRGEVGDPNYNPKSYPQTARLMYRAISEGGLGLEPIKSTASAGSIPWSRVRYDDDETPNPSTDSETMEILGDKSPILIKIADYRKLASQISHIFCLPEIDETGNKVYTKGLFRYRDPDGRIRSTYSPTTKTGRFRSSDPPLQNLAKAAQDDLDRIVGGDIPPVRSIFRGGWRSVKRRIRRILIESDYQKAEVFVLAFLSGDDVLLDSVRSPINFHCRNAVDILGTPCGYDDVRERYPALYVAAKSVSFGVPYQRKADALAREINRAYIHIGQKPTCNAKIAQGYIDGYYDKYKKAGVFLESCKKLVYAPGYIRNPYGRFRRFVQFDDEYRMKSQEREACNFPIQSTVSDTMLVALRNLWVYKKIHPEVEYEIINAVHDSVLLECDPEHVEIIVTRVLPMCMKTLAVIPDVNQSLDIEVSLFFNQGEKADPEEFLKLGIPERVLSLTA